jgi:hypothetical protein
MAVVAVAVTATYLQKKHLNNSFDKEDSNLSVQLALSTDTINVVPEKHST